MPYTYRIDDDLGLVQVSVWGAINDQEFRAHARRITSDPRLCGGMRVLCDYRAVARFDVTAQTLREMIEVVRMHPTFVARQMAIVAARDLMYGMARMYQILSDERLPQVEVFRDIAEARAWLGLPPAERERST